MDNYIKNANAAGIAEIDVDLLKQKWDHRFMLSQTNNDFLLIQLQRRGSNSIKNKCKISYEQATEIIKKLRLFRNEELFVTDATWTKKY